MVQSLIVITTLNIAILYISYNWWGRKTETTRQHSSGLKTTISVLIFSQTYTNLKNVYVFFKSHVVLKFSSEVKQGVKIDQLQTSWAYNQKRNSRSKFKQVWNEINLHKKLPRYKLHLKFCRGSYDPLNLIIPHHQKVLPSWPARSSFIPSQKYFLAGNMINWIPKCPHLKRSLITFSLMD